MKCHEGLCLHFAGKRYWRKKLASWCKKKQIKIYVFDFLKNPLYVKYVVEIKQKGKKHRAVVRS